MRDSLYAGDGALTATACLERSPCGIRFTFARSIHCDYLLGALSLRDSLYICAVHSLPLPAWSGSPCGIRFKAAGKKHEERPKDSAVHTRSILS
ncbi:hypothetical protein [Paenibacillus zanthoxyli]|uniref:hypothetical protein n=1 Tax=Paenibacillus zanthoxyli TaxID=369399 RepID=UPI0012EC34D6|nr:hypothetical protein [Paenibacillus zanthoxyli]